MTINAGGKDCPRCGKAGERQFTPPKRLVAKGFQSEETIQACEAERARLEARADDFKTGKLVIAEGGKYEPRLPRTVY